VFLPNSIKVSVYSRSTSGTYFSSDAFISFFLWKYSCQCSTYFWPESI